MQLIDTHSHLFLDEFNSDIDKVIQRALDNKIHKIFLPNVDITTINNLLECVERYPDTCCPMIGLHPLSVTQNYKNDLKTIDKQLTQNNFYGFGEIGIDLYRSLTYANEQKEAFNQQIDMAIHQNLPVIIHSRNAFNEIFEIIENKEIQKIKGIFHCFTGNIKQANRVIDLGFKIGIGGIITYPKTGLESVVEQIDIGHLVLETDAPYLAPVPHRGKRNESSYLVYIAQRIAEIKSISYEEVAIETSKNALEIFDKA